MLRYDSQSMVMIGMIGMVGMVGMVGMAHGHTIPQNSR